MIRPVTSISWMLIGNLFIDDLVDPVNLAFDRAGNLMVISYAGNETVYAFKPGAQDDDITLSDLRVQSIGKADRCAGASLGSCVWREGRKDSVHSRAHITLVDPHEK